MAPRLYRDKLFPVSVIANSFETFDLAGKSGFGVITADNWLGWDWLKEGADRYRKACEHAEPFAQYPITKSLGYFVATELRPRRGASDRYGASHRERLLRAL